MKTIKPNVVLLFSIALLGASLLLPIWRIEIFAPQYPEGLFLQISAGEISGNLDQINILNHYIGMKHILPSEIPELRIVPIALGVLAFIGLIAAITSKLRCMRIWFHLLSLCAAIGLIDFYLWGYDYGHNLNPDAPIKIPGMSYQPPLIGHKTLLNIDSYSLPDWGGYLLACSLLLAFIAAYSGPIRRVLRNYAPSLERKSFVRFFLGATIFLTVQGCNSGAEPIRPGIDSCDHCKMQISDARFGGEIITNSGRVKKFDSLHCLLGYYAENKTDSKTILLSDFLRPGELIKADTARFLRTDKIKDPMGPGLIASSDETGLKDLERRMGGKWLDWKNVLSSF